MINVKYMMCLLNPFNSREFPYINAQRAILQPPFSFSLPFILQYSLSPLCVFEPRLKFMIVTLKTEGERKKIGKCLNINLSPFACFLPSVYSSSTISTNVYMASLFSSSSSFDIYIVLHTYCDRLNHTKVLAIKYFYDFESIEI